jgi:uncharacterized membrane protein
LPPAGATIYHPQTISIALWSFVHLLVVGTLNALVLFGAFLAWSLAVLLAAISRNRAAGTAYPPGEWSRDAVTVIIGVGARALFAFALHGWLIGVRPFG